MSEEEVADDEIEAMEPRDALKLILEVCEPISTGDLDDPVERVCRIAEKSLDVPYRTITESKRELMNKLYSQAIYYRRMVLEMFDGLTQMSMRRVLEEGERLDRVLAEINDGKLPYRFESKVDNVISTAALLSKDAI